MRTYIIQYEAILGSVHPGHADSIYSARSNIAGTSMHKDGTERCQGVPPSPRWIGARERPQEVRHPRIQIQDMHPTRRVNSGGGSVLEVLEERESPTAQMDRVCAVR